MGARGDNNIMSKIKYLFFFSFAKPEMANNRISRSNARYNQTFTVFCS